MILTPNPVLNHVLLARRRFYSSFDVYPGELMPVVGTLAVAGGALQAATAGDWLGNSAIASEAWENLNYWPVTNGARTKQDATGLGIAPSGGTDEWILQIVQAGAAQASVSRILACLPGSILRISTRMRAPSANVSVNAASIVKFFHPGFVAEQTSRVTAEDAWQYKSFLTAACPADLSQLLLYLTVFSGSDTDTAWFDSVQVYRQNTPALVASWQSPNFVATLDHISPAAGVVPFSKLLRYENPLNFWEVRITPNLAGDDLTIWQIANGVGTPRAAADVDWTSNGLDQLRVVAEGAVIGLEYKKSGAGSWTDSADWSAATQGQGAPGIGPMFWGTGTGRLAAMEVVAR